MLPAAADVFRRQFGAPPVHVIRAPGRLELLGNHTDYNDGLVLALAIDRFITMAVSPRLDGRIEIHSTAFPNPARFPIDDLSKDDSMPWVNYVKGILIQLRQRRVHFSGFNCVIDSTIPAGAGMSSSGALDVATALAIRELHPYTLTPTGSTVPPKRQKNGELPPLTAGQKVEIARVCQQAESEFVGVNCGLLDPMSSLCGKAYHAIELDCQSLSVEHIPMIGRIAIVVCDTGVKHALVDSNYNDLRRHCESAARALGVKSLRAVDAPFLAANKNRLNDRDYECAYHIAGEIQRVVFGARALKAEDFIQFGQYMSQSHESSRDYFKNSCPELDLLVGFARVHPACLGARLTGGGFGGTTINLVRDEQAEAFSHAIAQAYQKRTGHDPKPTICRIVDGAGSERSSDSARRKRRTR